MGESPGLRDCGQAMARAKGARPSIYELRFHELWANSAIRRRSGTHFMASPPRDTPRREGRPKERGNAPASPLPNAGPRAGSPSYR
jgi:hypothetical protein